MPPVDIKKLAEQAKNRNLSAKVTAQQQQVKAMGGKAKKGGPSILSRVFDVISRPLYGISEGLARASEHVGPKNPRKGKNPVTDILEGMGMGVAGKTKTDFGDTLQRAAEAAPNTLLSPAIRSNRGNIKTIAGLAGSIAFDPTTYLGAGVVKSVGKQAAKTTGMRAGKEAVESTDSVRRVLEAADAAKQARLAKGPVNVADKAKGGRRLQTADEVAKKAELAQQKVIRSQSAIIRKEGEATSKAVELSTLAKNPGRVEFKFAGKKFAESEKLYKGTANLASIVGKTPAGAKLSEAFRTAHKFPEKTLQIKREAELRGIAHADIEIKATRDFFKALPKDDKILISHTIEKGSDAVNSMIGARPELAPFFEKAQASMREMGELEVKHGVFRAPKNKDPKDYLLDNYVYHYYEGGNKAARDKFKKMRRSAVGPESPDFTKLREIKTLEEAKQFGLKPLENIDDILTKRIGKHHAAMARSKYVDSVVKEYGVQTGSKWANQMAKEAKKTGVTPNFRGVNSKYVPKGTVFPENIAKSIEVLEKMHTDDELYRSFLRVFDAAQNHWKFGATSMNPGHHIRNLMGDGWNGFLDGVTDPRHYANARKVLWGKDEPKWLLKPLTDDEVIKTTNKFSTLTETEVRTANKLKPEELDNLLSQKLQQLNKSKGTITDTAKIQDEAGLYKGLLERAQLNPKFGKDDFKIIVNGKPLTRPQLMELFIESGTKPGFVATDLVEGTGKIRALKKPFNTVAEKREEYMRMAHFIHALKEEAPKFKTLNEAASAAGARVRKWKIDYGDLTDFERNVMKRAVPFYTWSRKNIPLQIEALALKPGRISTIPKGRAAIERVTGNYEGYNNDDLGSVPKWMKEMAPIRLRGEGEGKNAIYWIPSLPFQDVGKYTEGGEQGIAQALTSQLTPLARIPFEKATGKQTFSGANLPSNTQYAAGQVPLARLLHGIMTGKQSPASVKTLNYLTGAGVQEVTPGQVTGELNRQKRQTQGQIRAQKDKIRKKVTGG